MTKVDLLLLGLLLDKPMHGYEIDRWLKNQGIELWFQVSMPTIYYSLNKLAQKELISATRGPRDRSVYHITEPGRAAFFAAMEEALAGEEPQSFDYDVGILLLNKIPLDRALPLLARRCAHLERLAAQVKEAARAEEGAGVSPLKLTVLRHVLGRLEAEQSWTARFARGLQGVEATSVLPAHAMELAGNLRHFHFPDLLHLIASGRHTGVLTLSAGADVRTLGFSDGQLVCASSLREGERTQEPQRILDDLGDCFRWQEGDFGFVQGDTEGVVCIPVRLSVAALILHGSRWVDNWTTIQRYVPTAQSIFQAASAAEPADWQPSPAELAVLRALDGVTDVSGLAQHCQLSLFESSRILYGLVGAGLAQVADADRIRLRRLFREAAELICRSTLAWRSSPLDRSCEEEVNRRCAQLPLRLSDGRITDQTDPRLPTQELAELYRTFLRTQLAVIDERFGAERAAEALRQLRERISPDLRDVLVRFGFDRLL